VYSKESHKSCLEKVLGVSIDNAYPQAPNRARKQGTIAGVATPCNLIVKFGHDRPVPSVQTAMEEQAIDFLMSSDPPIPPMTIEAWLILAVMKRLNRPS
jgi:hypothetical protein